MRLLMPAVLVAALLASMSCGRHSDTSSMPTAGTAASVALTFDTGPDADPAITSEVLRTLRDNGVRATFVVTGIWVEAHRDTANAIAADGHLLVNGGYHGVPLTSQWESDRRAELSRTETTVYVITGRSTKPFYRTADSTPSPEVAATAASLGFDRAVPTGADLADLPADAKVTQALAAREPYIRMTLTADDAAALPGIIAGLRGRGTEFRTAAEVRP
jgi:peptidoglycan/xylan/chitin deacetylase (PgdA/CDA1 family)